MGKIDLHFHDLKTKSDSERKNISNEKIFDLSLKHDISLIGIVNHDFIDIKKCKDLIKKSELKDGVTFSFGFETNVVFDREKYWHLVLLGDHSILEQIKEILDDIKKIKKRNSETFINVHDLKDIIFSKKIDKNKIIIMPHAFKNKREIPKEKRSSFTELFKDYLIFYDTSNFRKMIINSKKAGIPWVTSDIKTIYNYEKEKVDNLPNISYDFKSLEQFIHFVKNDKDVVKKIINDNYKETTLDVDLYDQKSITSKNMIPIEENGKQVVFKFKYRKGINLIMGNRGTGKSSIAYSLYKNLNKNQNKNENAVYIHPDNIEKKYIDNISKFENHLLNNIRNYDVIKESSNYLSEILLKKNNEPDLTDLWESKLNYTLVKGKDQLSKLISWTSIDPKKESEKEDSNFLDKLKEWSNDFLLNNELLEFLLKIKLTQKEIKNLEDFNRLTKKIFFDKIKYEFKAKNKDELYMSIYKKLNLKYREKGASDEISKYYFKDSYKRKIDNHFNLLKANKTMLYILKKREIFEYDKIKYSFANNIKYKITIDIPDSENKSLNLNRNEYIHKCCFSNNANLKKIEFLYTQMNDTGFKQINNKVEVLLNLFNKNDQTKDIEKDKGNFDILDFLSLKFDIYDEKDSNLKNISLSKGQRYEYVIANILREDKKFIILDDIDASFDNKYLYHSFIPELHNSKKRTNILISTHSANLAINTIPNHWIYRKQNNISDKELYLTYYGDMYTDELKLFDKIEKDDTKKTLSWKDTAIDILEGGKEALEKREEIYNLSNKYGKW